MRRAHGAGLSSIALTDHDTVAGVEEARTAAAEFGMRVIAGCEFSARADWGEVHLLGYFLPLASDALGRALGVWQDARRRRAREIVGRLAGLGVTIEFGDVEATAEGAAIGRPHVARVLLDGGIVTSLDEAFTRWLGWGRPAFVPKELPEVREVTDLVHGLGGVVVLAHPGRHTGAKRVRVLTDAGLRGLEVLHPTHAAHTSERLGALADRFGLARTGGTDWHGDTMLRHERSGLGAITIPTEWLDELEARRD